MTDSLGAEAITETGARSLGAASGTALGGTPGAAPYGGGAGS